MNIYEYQAKEILSRHAVTVPKGEVATNPDEAEAIARRIGGDRWVVKAQILAGGRGKAGGIKFAESPEEAGRCAEEILSTPLKTHQTGNVARMIGKVLVTEWCDVAKELYFAITLDRARAQVVCIASSQGGVEIEETARTDPDAIFKEYVDPLIGMMPYQARNLAAKLGLKGRKTLTGAANLMKRLYDVFVQYDCALAEINPVAVTSDGEVVALDAKLSLDDSALGRHPEMAEMRDTSEELPAETTARESGLSYIALDGDIGCMVNGAGLAMATMDSIKVYGGEPANFLDVGGGASAEMITNAFGILMSDKKVKVILVNIFGGILQCDSLAEGIVTACQETKPSVPLVVRLEGTNVERGRHILKDSGLDIVAEETMDAAAQKAVALARQ